MERGTSTIRAGRTMPSNAVLAATCSKACKDGDPAAFKELVRLASLDPEAVRQAVQFDFSALPDTGHTLQDHEESLARLTSPEMAREAFQSLEDLAEKLRRRGQNRIVYVTNNPWGGGGVSSLIQAQGRLAKLLGIELEWHRLHATHSNTAGVPRELYTAMHFGMGARDFDVREEMKPWLQDVRDTYSLLQTVAHDPTVASVCLEDHQVAPLIPHFNDSRAFAAKPKPIMWRCHFDTLALTDAQARGDHDNPIIDFWHQTVGRFTRTLSPTDVVAYQRGALIRDPHQQAPLAELSPGVDPLEPRNTPLTKVELEAHLQEVERDHNIKLPRANTFVTGGRFVPQKGMAMVMRAFAEAAKEDPDVNLVIFGPNPSGDPIKDRYFDQLSRLHYSLEPHVRDRVFIVTGYTDVRRFYQLAAGDADESGRPGLPTILMSFAEGYNLMVDEANVAGCPVLSTTAVKRMGESPDLEPWRVELRDLGVPDPDAHYRFEDGRALPSSDEALKIEQRLITPMVRAVRLRQQDPKAYERSVDMNLSRLS
ncbi:MAG: glycosyltransferase, partial [Myxococcota bacterium]